MVMNKASDDQFQNTYFDQLQIRFIGTYKFSEAAIEMLGIPKPDGYKIFNCT